MIKKKRRIPKIVTTVWITIGTAFTFWLFYSYQSHGIDRRLFQSNLKVTVDITNAFYLFTPTKEFRNVFIFYPGAIVDPKAYIPLCRSVSESGIQVYLIKMPWRLASTGYNKPKELDLFSDTTKTYILSGHSQGAKMAAQFVYENLGLVDKLILIGTSHPRDISLADCKIPILKIYGSKDGIADEKSVLANKSKLPENAKFARIAGANHSQFGFYGFQLGDNRADIERDQQLAETLKNILEFVNN
ncbi:alpha/beta hydrolase [Pinibacter soli]|uniref:Alpha/beta hydrolase n=1 Tax=Pinibacter soli TaxID=3044211 RepID=A0ABT6RA43_9BACT|nr:alpha/beta hydrolase [Pinibacter soli]MDI3319428.1 alpha/beta hydrolase [Pinibacter soli]